LDILGLAVIGALCLAICWLSRPAIRRVDPADIFVIDGDTITIPGPQATREHIRISNIDAPELRGIKSLWQHKRAVAARDELSYLIGNADVVEIRAEWTKDPFGRTLARVRVVMDTHRVDVGRHLVKSRLARAWTR